MIQSIIAFALLITIHEFGHLIAGRIFNIPVDEFAIGIGPKIWGKKGNKETMYTLRAIPLGGFCSFRTKDTNPDCEGVVNRSKEYEYDERATFDEIHPLKRICIFLAGPLMNLVVCFVLLAGVSYFSGTVIPSQTVMSVVEGGPSDGLLFEGDEILAVDELEVSSVDTMLIFIKYSTLDEVLLSVNRDDVITTVSINATGDTGSRLIGVTFGTFVPMTFSESVSYAGHAIVSSSIALVSMFVNLFRLQGLDNVGGVISIVQYGSQSSTVSSFILFVSSLSLNLGVLNLLPIPMLDGFGILSNTYEALFKKKIPNGMLNALVAIGALLLLGLMLFANIKDVVSLFL